MIENHPLRVFRERHDPPLSQEELAKLIGINRVAVTRWESGARQPPICRLAKIKEVTGISPLDLRPDIAELVNEDAA